MNARVPGQAIRNGRSIIGKVKYGISLSNRSVVTGGNTVAEVVDMAVTAEISGAFDGVWVGDNLLSKPRLDYLVLLSAIAARTSRVNLGTICMASFPLRNPVQLAIQWSSLDVLSGGRTILAV